MKKVNVMVASLLMSITTLSFGNDLVQSPRSSLIDDWNRLSEEQKQRANLVEPGPELATPTALVTVGVFAFLNTTFTFVGGEAVSVEPEEISDNRFDF